jgi:hypothetical protein
MYDFLLDKADDPFSLMKHIHTLTFFPTHPTKVHQVWNKESMSLVREHQKDIQASIKKAHARFDAKLKGTPIQDREFSLHLEELLDNLKFFNVYCVHCIKEQKSGCLCESNGLLTI